MERPARTSEADAERAKAREAIFDIARRIREAGSPDVAALPLSPAEAASLERALKRHAADLRHDDPECSEALSSARWACISTPAEAAQWAADRAYFAAVDRATGATVRQLAAVSLLLAEGRADPALAAEWQRKRARASLEAELFKATAAVAAEASALVAPLDAGGPLALEAGQPFPVDLPLAAALEATGDGGRECAADLREKSAARVGAYLERPSPETARALVSPWAPGEEGESLPPALRTLTWALWKDVVRPPLAATIARRPPAVASPALRDIMRLCSPNHELRPDGSLVVASGPDRGAQIAHVSADLIEAMRGNVDFLSSVAAWKLLRWEVLKAHEQHHAGYGDRTRVLEVPGGWLGLCKAVGLPERDENVKALRKIVEAQALFVFRFPDGSEGNMLAFNHAPAMGRFQRAHLRLVLDDVLLPDYTRRIQEKRGRFGYASRMARRLVPMPHEWPPTVGRHSDYAKQMGMALAFMAAFRSKAEAMAAHPRMAAPFELDEIIDIAVASGMPHSNRAVLPVLNRWKDEKDPMGPFLLEVERDLYTLGPRWHAERDFIVAAGRKEAGGRKRAEEHSAKKTKWLLGK